MADEGTTDDRRPPTRPDVALKVEYPTVDTFLEDYSVNISKGGTTIRVDRELAVGDEVELHLSFPGLLTLIRLAGAVRWVQQDGADHQAGVEIHQGSPSDVKALAALVDRILTGDRTVVAPVVRVIVVEDNPHVARLLRDGLDVYRRRSTTPIAFLVRHAANGKEALGMLEESPADLLFVDMYLPVLDGETLIRAVRQDPGWREIPIIALSAGGEDARQGAVLAGADYFLEKPVRLAEVLSVMQTLIGTPGPAEG
jgi:uncharacterized protein (TIGR02266 family)